MEWQNLFDFDQHDIKSDHCFIATSGMSTPETWGRWSCEPEVNLSIPRNKLGDHDVAIIIELMPHIDNRNLKSQKIAISHNGIVIADWDISDSWYRLRGLVIAKNRLSNEEYINLHISIPNAISPQELGVNDDSRKLGIGINRIWVANINQYSSVANKINELGSRFVGQESRKTWDIKQLSGFWDQFITGPNVLDIGFSSYGDPRVVPIVDGAIGVDIDYPGYDGKRLPFDDGSQDTVYSSHCLEHISDPLGVIQDWYRVTKIGGHIIIAVPSRDLFERRRRPPSLWNTEHLRMYSCSSLLTEIESALQPNSFKVRYLSENDDLFDYTRPPEISPYGNYEITVVIEKISPPKWNLVD